MSRIALAMHQGLKYLLPVGTCWMHLGDEEANGSSEFRLTLCFGDVARHTPPTLNHVARLNQRCLSRFVTQFACEKFASD